MADTAEFQGTARFQIKRRLGAGGFGTVYEALDRKRNAIVALKVLRQASTNELYGFKQEFHSLAGITHRNLVTLYELFFDGNDWFFSMEFVRGTDLLTYVFSTGPLGRETYKLTPEEQAAAYPRTAASSDELSASGAPPEAAVFVGKSSGPSCSVCSIQRLVAMLLQLAEGLLALHGEGLVHRDIKPANVLCTWEGRVVVLDFGLAQPTSPQTELRGPGLGLPTTLAGTPDYMSPEQAAGQPLTAAADWYSVGVLLYEALTGGLPFSGTPHQVLRQKISQVPPRPCAERPDIPVAIDALCMQLLERQPERRPSGKEVIARLREFARTLDDAADAALYHSTTGSADGTGSRLAQEAVPFLGRERQIAALAEAFVATRKGQTVTVLCHGGSGAGKSTLCKQFLKALRERDERPLVLSGRCYEHEDVPFKVLDGVVDSLSWLLRHCPREETEALLPRDVVFLSRLFPVLLQVPAIKASPQRRIADDLQVRQAAFAALRELMISLAQHRPLVLYVDDLQWGDEDGISLLLEVLRPPPPPLLLIVSYRSEEEASSAALQLLRKGLRGELGQGVALREVPVPELNTLEAEALARTLLASCEADAEKAKQRAATIAAEARGNAFFITELARSAADALPPSAPTLLNPTSLGPLDAIIQARVARLPEAPRQMLLAIAVAGQPVARAVTALAAYGDAKETDEPQALALLRSERLVRVRHARGDRQGGGSSEELLTYHDRVREAVVAGLSPAALGQQHLRLAQALELFGQAEPEQLVFHLHRGGDLSGAASYAVQASAQAEKALAYHQVVRLCRAALDTGKLSANEAYVIKARLADALAGTGRPKEAGEAYLHLLAHESSDKALQRRRQAAKQFFAGGYVAEGRQVLVELLSAVRLSLPRQPLWILGSIGFYRLLIALRGTKFHERSELAVPQKELLRIDICEAVSSIVAVDPILACHFCTKALWYALRAGEPRRLARALTGEALALAGSGTPQSRVEPMVAQATALVERLGDAYSRGHLAYVRGHIDHLRGRWKESSQRLRRAAEILKDECIEATMQIDFVGTLQLYNLRWMGELEQLAEELPPLLKDATERGKQSQAVIVRLIAGFLLPLREDDPDRAEDWVRSAKQLISTQPFNLQHIFALEANLMILLYRGRGSEAWQLLAQHRAAFARSGQLWRGFFKMVWQHLTALVALAALQPLALAEQGAQALMGGDFLFCAPMAALVKGLLRKRQGRKEEALALLAEAEERFTACDMSLHAACARFRRGTWLVGDAGEELTQSARRLLAKKGVRNPERLAAMMAPA